MRIIYFCLLAFLFSINLASAQDALPGEFNGKVIFVTVKSEGTVTVNCIGFDKKVGSSIDNAAAGAVYTLIFRGIAGSPYNLPMVADENGKKNDPVIVALLNGGYAAFIIENTLTGTEAKKKRKDGVKGKQTVSLITINCDALRRHLEQNKIIRKFGI